MPASAPSTKPTSWLITIALPFAFFAAEAVLFQVVGGAYSSDFSSTSSDEAAHFVTGLMVREFMVNGDWLHPVEFARNYYLHYPKVAIGHWPPLYYALLAGWQLLWGSSRAAALGFVAMVGAAVSTTMFVAGRRVCTPPMAFVTGATFLALPLAREAGSQVMAELLVTLSLLVATLICAEAVRIDSRRSWVAFGVAAGCAVLVSGSGWSIGLVPPLVVLFAGRLELLRSPRLWLAAATALGLCAPWYIVTQPLRAAEGAFIGGGMAFVRQALVAFPTAALDGLGTVLATLAVIGLVSAAIRRSPDTAPLYSAVAVLPFAKVLLHVLVPAGLEARYVLGAMPSALLLAGLGIDACVDRAAPRRRAALRGLLLVAALLPVAFAGATMTPQIVHGYAEAAQEVSTAAAPQVILLASDSRGEGAWIAALAARRPAPADFVLRASKVFVDEDWLGRNPTDRFASLAETKSMLDASPITTVVLDRTTDAVERRSYHDRLARAVREDTAWRRVAIYPLHRFGVAVPGGLEVFRRTTLPPVPADAAHLASLGMRADLR